MAIPQATVTAYSKNNFNASNVPGSEAVLVGASTVTQLEAINCLPFGGTHGSIVVKYFAEYEFTSYIKIRFNNETYDKFFIVVDKEPVSMGSIRFELHIDPLLTVGGVAGIDKIAGLTSRHLCLDDTLGKYTMRDDLIMPSKPLIIRGQKKLYSETDQLTYTIIASTIGLDVLGDLQSEASRFAVDFESGTGNVVTAPAVPPVETPTTVVIYKPDGTHISIQTPGYGLYDGTVDRVKLGMVMARSLGVEDGILASYKINAQFCDMDVDENTGFIERIYCKAYTTVPDQQPYHEGAVLDAQDSEIPFEYGNVMNKRLFVGECNKAGLLILSSGARTERDIADLILEGKDTITVDAFSDGRPHGKIYYNFSNILGDEDGKNFIHGPANSLEWENAPLRYEQSSGVGIRTMLFENQREISAQQHEYEMTQADIGLLASAATAVGGFASGNVMAGAAGLGSFVMGSYNREMKDHFFKLNRQQEMAQFVTSNYIVAPELNFPLDEGLRQVYGGCLVYVIGYDDLDLERLDKILNMYGYKDVKPLELSDLNSGKYFNYIECTDVQVKTKNYVSRIIKDELESMLSGGVRIWKVNPNPDLYNVSNRPD